MRVREQCFHDVEIGPCNRRSIFTIHYSACILRHKTSISSDWFDSDSALSLFFFAFVLEYMLMLSWTLECSVDCSFA